jgi:hypothetical protein
MDAQPQDAQQHIQRCEDVIRRQMDVIREQRAEIDRLVSWIMADTDALTCLQAVYNDPAATENNRIKAASAALPFERTKLSVSVQVTGPGVLGARLDQTKPPMKTVSPPLIEHVASGD